MRKSPSMTSSTSIEAFVPRRRKLSKDKDCLSMQSEKIANIYRRFSLANGRGCCKVRADVPVIHLHLDCVDVRRVASYILQ